MIYSVQMSYDKIINSFICNVHALKIKILKEKRSNYNSEKVIDKMFNFVGTPTEVKKNFGKNCIYH